MNTESSALRTRHALPRDLEAIAAIYNEGIADRTATFETRPRTAADLAGWLDGRHPVIVVEEAQKGAGLIAFASTSVYRARECYAGVTEFSVYVARAARGRGAGRLAMAALIEAAHAAGFWKLVSRVFPENTASRALLRSLGFREPRPKMKEAGPRGPASELPSRGVPFRRYSQSSQGSQAAVVIAGQAVQGSHAVTFGALLTGATLTVGAVSAKPERARDSSRMFIVSSPPFLDQAARSRADNSRSRAA